MIVILTSATGFSAAGGWYWFTKRWMVWPIAIGTMLAGLVAVAVAISNRAWPSPERDGTLLRHRVQKATSNGRAQLAMFVAIFVAVGALIHGSAATVTRREATARNAIRWFAAQQPSPVQELHASTAGAVRVVAFTDHQMPSGRKFLQWVDLVEAYRRNGSRVELIVLSYPFNPDCGDVGVPLRSPTGCEAAYAVKLAQRSLGDKAAMDLSRWFYERALALSSDLVRSRLDQLQLGDQWSREGPELKGSVARDVAFAKSLGVRTVPTIFVNGIRLPPGTDMLLPVLEHELGPLNEESVGRAR